ncbi:uncharacterized protein AKAW2_30339A [Aspergillus luchuensis]|uniref:Uncharacterized protein n=4 Tax=Aspergillus subgen. Circumdati TaxID=2720871 RepID=A0A8G1R3Y8_9EURO|nr:hypothetical protein BO85DRAFT_519938 [Aspergillus piperis CBS 112811]XP_041540786.1 uncharacterized protein AKAW2_30339A [Aspergillus luchuensis]OJZ87621.1 hypothetical protein ASPFODRAFT_45312 [Aspergillus luchuensis CBS 106.47]GAA87417.1 hypothetical protein AKAW_05531 [Aspergillus luchuensis IFO 4308]RAH58062.1 hypothetical protein BO85DRAFT_519938 [Aspergillus piperis CBS 112811]BCR97020.1 hypothetical protein AKAW2_30339A [Aspergillus luchuensis]
MPDTKSMAMNEDDDRDGRPAHSEKDSFEKQRWVFTHGTSNKGGREYDRLFRLEPQKFLIEVAVDRPAGGRRRELPGTWIGVESPRQGNLESLPGHDSPYRSRG